MHLNEKNNDRYIMNSSCNWPQTPKCLPSWLEMSTDHYWALAEMFNWWFTLFVCAFEDSTGATHLIPIRWRSVSVGYVEDYCIWVPATVVNIDKEWSITRHDNDIAVTLQTWSVNNNMWLFARHLSHCPSSTAGLHVARVQTNITGHAAFCSQLQEMVAVIMCTTYFIKVTTKV